MGEPSPLLTQHLPLGFTDPDGLCQPLWAHVQESLWTTQGLPAAEDPRPLLPQPQFWRAQLLSDLQLEAP